MVCSIMVEFDVTITSKDLYDYMLRHTYNSPMGIVGSCAGALLIVFAAMTNQWIYVVLGLVVLLYLPWSLFLKSKQQALTNPGFKKPLHYVLDEEGITVSQDEASEKQAWDDMVKAVSTSRGIFVYTSPINACIFPKAQLGDKKAAVIEMISTHMPPNKVKIRG